MPFGTLANILASLAIFSYFTCATGRVLHSSRTGDALARGLTYLRSGHRATSSEDPVMDSPEASTFMDRYLDGVNVSQIDADSDPPRNATAEAMAPKRTVVVAKYDEDIAWLQNLPKNYDVWIYQSKDSSQDHFVENLGNEATKYLSFLVENYDALPDSMVFVQAGKQDWHDPVPKDVSLRRWKWGDTGSHGGMKFLPTNAPCLVEDSAKLQPHPPPQVPVSEMCMATVEHVPKQMDTVREVWPSVFEQQLGPLPQRWLTHCCAQFEVTRDAVQRHPREFYESVLSWALQHDRELAATDYAGDMKRNHDPERRDAGHVMEPLWTLLFTNPDDRFQLPDQAVSSSE